MPCRTSINSTPASVSTPNQNSRRDSRRMCCSLREAMMCQTAWMIRAASTASGKVVKRGVRKSRVTIVTAHATRSATWVRAPAPSLTAEADMLPPAIIPPKRALARLVTAWAFSSWSASTS